jgi:hypothetical protein
MPIISIILKKDDMTNLRIRIAIIALMIIVSGMGCSNTKADKNMRNDANATIDKAGDTLSDASKAIQLQIDTFHKDMSANVASADTQFEQLQTRRDAMTDEKNKSALDARVVQLKKQRDDLQVRIDKMDSQSKDETKWKNFEDETKFAWHKLESGLKDTFTKLGG